MIVSFGPVTVRTANGHTNGPWKQYTHQLKWSLQQEVKPALKHRDDETINKHPMEGQPLEQGNS